MLIKPKGIELRRFGEMATLQIGSKTWVVLNSIRTVNEIINKRGSITNGRPDYPVSSDLMSRSKRSVLLKVPEWSDRRRVTHQVLSGSAMKSYAEYQDVESLQLLTGYMDQPSKWYQHHARYSNSTIYRIAFGKRVLSITPQLAAIRQVHEDFLEHNPPNNIIDCFPRLSNLPRPFQWWRKSAEKLGQRAFDVYKGYWDPVLREIQEGQAPASFARDLLVGDDAKFKGSDEDAMYLSGELIEAGSETTRISHDSFVMAAICYPDVIQKARAELDQICGNSADRLPNFDDEPSLTYILAFIKELLRWKPIIVWGTEHCLTEDLEFEGYRFPKHTNFVINNAATAQDTDYFENPDEFRPERWLDGRESDILHGTTTFGGGRRVCVGYRLAQKSLYLNIARLIYCFDFYSVSAL
jgi:cytochrome P450